MLVSCEKIPLENVININALNWNHKKNDEVRWKKYKIWIFYTKE